MLRVLVIILFTASLAQAQLNTRYDEQNPVLSPSKNEMYFTVANHPLNVSGERDKGDIWVSRKQNGQWAAPVRVNGLVNNGGYNAVLGFSLDGEEMFLYGHYTTNGDAAGSQGISVSKRNGNTWSLPKNETIPYFLNKSIASGGSITSNKKVFVFSAEGRTHDSFGNEDIYVSFNRDGVWTEPLNLGGHINSISQEYSPFYDAGTSILYYSSNKAGGNGSFDVYRCSRLDDTWQNWSKPENMGSNINTDGREVYYRLIPDGFIYTSTKNSDGYGDIKEGTVPNNFQEIAPTEDEKPIVTITTPPPANSFSLFGRVTDAQTGQGINAKMVFVPTASNHVASSQNGQYNVTLPLATQYLVSISANGYISIEEPIILQDKNVQTLEINFKLQPVAVGVSVNLRHVLFRQSSPELLPESYDELDKVVDLLKENPTVEIELSGHTDDAGKASLNLKLSRDRVNRVKYYLVERGIAASRVKGVGYGETKPIASNKTDEGRRMNRRVEFKILKK
jgi:OOP family OmpA-OmpF porin